MNWKTLAIRSSLVAGILFALVAAYYYWTTPRTTIVVLCDDFPATLSSHLLISPEAVADDVVSQLRSMINTADSSVVANAFAQQEGQLPRPVSQKVLPIRALSLPPDPVFKVKLQGMDLNLAHRLGMYLRTSTLLELRVIGVKNGWQLVSVFKKPPSYTADKSARAPREGGPCVELQSCAKDLAEQALNQHDPRRALNYYIKTNTDKGNRQILDLYSNMIPASSLDASDLVAWGNAFSGLKRYDDALHKYHEALDKDSKYCPALIARGLVYYLRPHGKQMLKDMRLAKGHFIQGVECDPKNKYAQTDLCIALIREWSDTQGKPQLAAGTQERLLEEAQEHCKKALEIDQDFAPADVNLAYSLYRQGKRDESLAHFKKIREKYENNSAFFLNYGFCLYLEYLRGKADALEQAIDMAHKALELNPGSYVAANNLGFFYYEQQEYDKAVESWKKADQLRGDDADSTAGLALGLFKTGHESEALATLSKAVKLDPHYRDPSYLRRNFWSDQAVADIELLISKLPRDRTYSGADAGIKSWLCITCSKPNPPNTALPICRKTTPPSGTA